MSLTKHLSDVTGKADAKIGLVDIYDVFGMASQTIQGADLLAARLNAVVLIPDFFDGEPLKHEYVPADTDEKKQIIAEFTAHKANIPRNVGVVIEAVEEYRTRFTSVQKWGAFGLCWGGKVSLTLKWLDVRVED
jgi:dienelactone hydrolase